MGDPGDDGGDRRPGTATDGRGPDVPDSAGQQVRDGPTTGDAAAFFDLDNTVVRGAALFHLAVGLWHRRFFTHRAILRGAWHQVRFRVSGAESSSGVETARDRLLTLIAGYPVEDLQVITEEVVTGIVADNTWPGTVALARAHVAAGEHVWLVTAAPVEVATTLAARLGLTGALGTVAESVDGHYTGRLIGEVLRGPAKAAAVAALAETHGLDLTHCSAYSDSSHDVPLLSMVGHPHAINPDRALRRLARSRGWSVDDYRRGRRAAYRCAQATAVGLVVGLAVGVGTAVTARARPAG